MIAVDHVQTWQWDLEWIPIIVALVIVIGVLVAHLDRRPPSRRRRRW